MAATMAVMGVKYADHWECLYREQLGKTVGVKIPKGAFVSVGNDGVTRILTKDWRYEVDTNGTVRKFKRICDSKCKGDSLQRNANRFGLIGNAKYAKTGETICRLKPAAKEGLATLVDKDVLAEYSQAMSMQLVEEVNAMK